MKNTTLRQLIKEWIYYINNMKNTTLRHLIEECKFNYVNKNITEDNFPRPDKIQTENWILIRIDHLFNSQEALDKIKKQGCRPANCWELVEWASEHKYQLKEYEYCLAFGQLWIDSDGCHRVPFVYRGSVGVFGLCLGDFGSGWDDDYCILGVFDSDSKTPENNSLELRLREHSKEIDKINKFLCDNFCNYDK